MSDNVNHPSHYDGATSIECIDAMELILGTEGLITYCIGNVFKYLWRWEHKNGIEDIKKAKWYLNKARLLAMCEYGYDAYRKFSCTYSKLSLMIDEAKDKEEQSREELEDE